MTTSEEYHEILRHHIPQHAPFRFEPRAASVHGATSGGEPGESPPAPAEPSEQPEAPQQPDDGETKQDPAPLPQTEGQQPARAAKAPFTGWPILH